VQLKSNDIKVLTPTILNNQDISNPYINQNSIKVSQLDSKKESISFKLDESENIAKDTLLNNKQASIESIKIKGNNGKTIVSLENKEFGVINKEIDFSNGKYKNYYIEVKYRYKDSSKDSKQFVKTFNIPEFEKHG